MFSPKTGRLFPALAAGIFSAAILHAQPDNVVSEKRTEGVMVTRAANPEHFIFQCGIHEEHFDGTKQTLEAQGGPEVAEPIAGLHYLLEHLAINGTGWSEQDTKLMAAEFHDVHPRDFYFFKTIEGHLFYLPKEGETAVTRVDYILKDGHSLTLWVRK